MKRFLMSGLLLAYMVPASAENVLCHAKNDEDKPKLVTLLGTSSFYYDSWYGGCNENASGLECNVQALCKSCEKGESIWSTFKVNKQGEDVGSATTKFDSNQNAIVIVPLSCSVD